MNAPATPHSHNPTIRTCHAAGMTLPQAAKALRITEKAARGRAHRLRIRFGENSHTRAEDEALLTLLDLRDGDLMLVKESGARMGMTKGAAVGQINRIYNAHLPCACTKPENMDGGMPRGWWK